MSTAVNMGAPAGTQKSCPRQTGIPATRYQDAPALSDRKTIVYLGGLYAGGVLGLAKTLRSFSLRDGQKLLLVTVGLADPNDQENRRQYSRDPAKAASRRTA